MTDCCYLLVLDKTSMFFIIEHSFSSKFIVDYSMREIFISVYTYESIIWNDVSLLLLFLLSEAEGGFLMIFGEISLLLSVWVFGRVLS
jgi:hypothetical protein